MKIAKLLALAAVCTGVSVGGQTVFVVPPETPGASPGYPFYSWGNAATSIHDAVDAAVLAGVTQVFVSNGLYHITNEISVKNALYLRSWNNGAIDQTNTIINAGGLYRGFFVSNANAVVDGFMVTNAATNAVNLYHGVIRNCDLAFNLGRGATIGLNGILEDCRVRENYIVAHGGGVYLSAGTVRRCAIVGNIGSSYYGGGVYIMGGGKLLDSSIISNQCVGTANGWGGGVFVSELGLVSNCLIQANRTFIRTAGIFLSAGGGGNIVVDKCVIVDNVITGATGGGGSYMNGGVLRNSLIARNSGVRGGGIFMIVASNLIENCTIVSNSASERGGGVYGPGSVATDVLLMNNIIYFNNSPNGSNLYNQDMVFWTNNCTAPSVNAYGSGNITDDPAFVSFAPDMDAADYDFRLTADSRCVNTGTNQPSMSSCVDLDGRTRIDRFYRLVDMGCYEYVPGGMLFGIR